MTTGHLEKTAFMQAVAAGCHFDELADRFGITYHAAWKRAERYGLKVSHKKKGPPLGSGRVERPEIIALREEGKTYQQIGEQVGVSRQRIEQILERDRPDLCYRRSGPVIPRGDCLHCGKKLDHKPVNARFCNRDCAKAYRNTSLTPWMMQVIQIVFERRCVDNPPKRWEDIAAELGCKSIQGYFKRACERANIDPSPAYGKYGRSVK